ncbi:MAG: hypothetical protein QOJ80_5003 [Mycobacterium sp.]|nr:hypothetical protein [Mycobacterium sp.]
MSIISFRVPIAVSAAGIAAAGAVIVALSPVAHADDEWGSCAAPGRTTDTVNATCLSTPYPDQASAEKRALTLCNHMEGRGCTVVVSYTDCGAIAGDGTQWVGGRALTKQDAEQDALNQLSDGSHGHLDGTIAKSACVTLG